VPQEVLQWRQRELMPRMEKVQHLEAELARREQLGLARQRVLQQKEHAARKGAAGAAGAVGPREAAPGVSLSNELEMRRCQVPPPPAHRPTAARTTLPAPVGVALMTGWRVGRWSSRSCSAS
jgi:hypothetical protein